MSKIIKKLGYQMIDKKIVLGKYRQEEGLLVIQGKGQDLTHNAISCVFLWFQENLEEQQAKDKNIISHEVTYDGQDEVLVMFKKKDWQKIKYIYNNYLKDNKEVKNV